jgi:uncharacterized protein
MSLIAPFDFWPRRNRTLLRSAAAGAVVQLDEGTEYVFQFKRALSPFEQRQLLGLGGEMLADDTAILNFGNFLGHTELAGVSIEVVSTKIGAEGTSRVLEEVSELASALIYGWKAPLGFAAVPDHQRHAPVPYHQLQFLRQVVLRARPGERLQDFIGTIERNVSRRFERERPVLALSRVKCLDQRAVQSVFSRLDRLVSVPLASAISASPLAQKLTFGEQPRVHFPERIAAPRGNLSFDTPENRFVKHVLLDCLSLVYRFAEHPKLHAQLRADCREMIAILEQFLTVPFIAESTRLSTFTAPSQTLAKADGYRDIFALWGSLTRHVSLPSSVEQTQRLLEGRDMALLYEYWVFMKILEAVTRACGSEVSAPPQVTRSELGETLTLGLTSHVAPEITVRFNPSFSRSAGTAYSTPLRPDVTLQVGQHRFAFDAKYKLERLNLDEDDVDEGLITYKRADLYKMHAYRDAIQPLQAAFVVYPGTEFAFFERSGIKRTSPDTISSNDGVGVVPLRPTEPEATQTLRTLMYTLLSPSLTPPAGAAAPK